MKVGLILCFITYPNSVLVLISFVFSSFIINEFEIITCQFCTGSNDSTVSNAFDETEQRLPELVDLLANRGLKMFHQNIRGLGIHKAKLEEYAGSFRGIDLLGL